MDYSRARVYHYAAIRLLSPYKNKLENSVLFMQMIGSRAQSPPSLISPHVGNQVPIANRLSAAVPCAAIKEQSITALPIGSCIELNPWTSRVDLLKSKLTRSL